MNNTKINATLVKGNGTDGVCYHVKCHFNTAEITLIMTSAFIIFLAGAIGNLCTAIVVISSKRFRSISNLSTLNLAIANLFLSLFIGPIRFVQVYMISNRWVFGLVFCKLFGFLNYSAVIATLLNLLVVSIERFVAICFPFFLKMHKKLFIYAVPLVWLVAFAVAAPNLMFDDIVVARGQKVCLNLVSLKWANFLRVLNQVLLYSVMGVMIPLQIITISMLKVKGSAIKDNSHAQYARRRNACYILFLLMLSCLICWLPLRIAVSIFTNNKIYDFKMVNIIYAVFSILFFVSTVIHAVIFFFLSPKGKRSLRAVMKKSKRRAIASPENSKINHSGRRRTLYWPFSGISMRSSSMTKDTML